MYSRYSLLLSTLLFSPLQSYADNFRCPNTGKIVEEGMNPYEVVINCGEPAAKTPLSTVNQLVGGSLVSVVQAEEWTYDFGPNQLIRKLHFENGRLKSFVFGDRGVKLPEFVRSAKKK